MLRTAIPVFHVGRSGETDAADPCYMGVMRDADRNTLAFVRPPA
jgi:hypothetical protein